MIQTLDKKQIENISGGIFECHCTPLALTTTDSVEECAWFCCVFLKYSSSYTAYPFDLDSGNIDENGAQSGECLLQTGPRYKTNETKLYYDLPHGLLEK